jgi:hypothetical protein
MKGSRFTPGQLLLAGGLLVLTIAGFVFWWLREDHVLRETSALFIGLPALLAIGMALSAPAKSVTGSIFKAATIFLLMLGPVLQEGFICVLMMSPIYFAVVASVAGLISWLGKRNQNSRMNALLLVPVFAVLSLESANGLLHFPNQAAVTATRILQASPAEVEAALARGLRFDAPLPTFLNLGFPKPISNQDVGLELGVRRRMIFNMPEGATITFKVTTSQCGPKSGTVIMTHESNFTPVERWLRLNTSEMRWQEISSGQTRLEWTLRFTRRLSPAWYFQPLEVFGVEQAANYLVQTLDLH